MIHARLRKSFSGGTDASGFTLDIEFQTSAGVTVLFGPSGAGKTLTLDAIAGFVRPEQGRILLDDAILFDAGADVHLSPQQRNCGYVFQNYALFPHMTLRENLEFAAERTPRLQRSRRVSEMLDRFRLSDVAGRRPHEVSGGQKQRCSIARALVGAPKLLLLDEPARGLDAPLRIEFYAVLRQVRAEFQTPILLVTHDLDECFELGDEMLVLRDGKLVQSGPPRRVLDRPASLEVARLLGRLNLLAAEVLALDPGRNTSRLRLDEFELNGPYLPGHLLGDRVWLCIRPDELRAIPRDGRPGPNQIPATLVRALDLPQFTRLEFSNDIQVDALDKPPAGVRDWLIEFPAHAVRVI
jgi:molybdate transport system ATP-binding protein